MGELEEAELSANWRPVARMAYPVDLPERRAIRVQYALGWMALHHLPISSERVQVDTYVTCSLVLETLTHLSGSFVPEYLVERIERMLEHQIVSGYYPRLALAPRERFASKGGFIVHFSDAAKPEVIPNTPWMIP
jgi:hypothetical protein